MRKAILLLVVGVFLFSAQAVFADVANPDFLTERCNPGETVVECRWSRSNMAGPVTDGCVKYANNPSYRYLVGEGSTFGGRVKYCFKPISSSETTNFHLQRYSQLFWLTLIIEFPVFLLLGLRQKRVFVLVPIVNLISTALFYLATILTPLRGALILFGLEFLIVILESSLLRVFMRDISFKKIFWVTLAANATSAILGGIILGNSF